jgi:Protein of unknown function (DUF2934)
MIVSKVKKQAKPAKVAAPKAAAIVETTMLGIRAPQDQIRERAFQIYQSRSSVHGFDLQDWLHAERQVETR